MVSIINSNYFYTTLKKYFIIILILVFKNVHAQFLENGNGIGIHYTAGHIVKHTSKINIDPPSFSEVVEVSYSHQTNGSKLWQQRFGMPQWGFAFTYCNFLRNDMGKVFSLIPTIQFKLTNKINNPFYVKMGSGLAYATVHWHRVPYTDSLNNFLGSAVNLFATLQFGKQFKLFKNYHVDAGFSLSHTSNAGTYKPNYGINLFGVYAGIQLKNKVKLPDHIFEKTQKSSFGIGLKYGLSMYQYNNANGPLLPNYNVSIYGYKVLNQKHKLFTGIDYNLSKRTEFFLRNTYQTVKSIPLSSSNAAVIIGNEFLLGHFSIPTMLGFNFYYPFLKQNLMFEKFGLYYYPYKNNRNFLRNLFIGELLKVYFFKAEYLETSIGCNF